VLGKILDKLISHIYHKTVVTVSEDSRMRRTES